VYVLGVHVANIVLKYFRIWAFIKFRISGLFKSGIFLKLLASLLIKISFSLLNWIRQCNKNCFAEAQDEL